VLHSPAYRKTYREFLKVDFPRIPYPESPRAFWEISEKGERLRRLHLMQPDSIGEAPYSFKGEGDNVVGNPGRDEEGRVWINKTQHFESVPQTAWELYIGGYQPAQKWLNDRKRRALNFDDVQHYQRIVKVLSETDRVMKTIRLTLEP
jgi:predicted helicase